MDEQERLELLKKDYIRTLNKIDEELSKITETQQKSESSDSKPSTIDRAIEKSFERPIQIFEEDLLLFNSRRYIQNPSLLGETREASIKQMFLETLQPQSNSGEISPNNALNPAYSFFPEDHSTFSEFFRGDDFYPGYNWDENSKATMEARLREKLLLLIKRAKDFWTEYGSFEGFEAKPRLNYEIENLICDLNKVPTCGIRQISVYIEYYLLAALQEIEVNIPFNWKGFVEVFDRLPSKFSYALYLIETNCLIWPKRGDFRVRMLAQINNGQIILPDGKYTFLTDRQQKILKVYYETGRPMHYLEAASKATLDLIEPGDWYNIDQWKDTHPDKVTAYRISQIFKRMKKVKDYLLETVDVRRGVYRAAF